MTDADLARFFLALVLVLSAALAGGHVFARLRLPRVIGEIAGGIVLGPSGSASRRPRRAPVCSAAPGRRRRCSRPSIGSASCC